MNQSNATPQWGVAHSRLDGNDTIIYSNPSISAQKSNTPSDVLDNIVLMSMSTAMSLSKYQIRPLCAHVQEEIELTPMRKKDKI